MINVVKNNDEYKITFPYDYNIKEIVKTVNGHRWNPESKSWSIPINSLGMLVKAFEGTEYQDLVHIESDEAFNKNETLDVVQPIPDIDISKIKTYVRAGSKLYPHQIDFMKFAINREENEGNFSGFLVADTPGLGKSLESINLALYNKKYHNFRHCLILVCINSSKYNWYDEVKSQTDGKYEAYILGSRMSKRGKINFTGSTKDKLDDLNDFYVYDDKKYGELPYFIIMNVEALRGSGRNHPIADKLIQLINSGIINMMIIDEVHKNLSPTSQQGKQILRIKKSVGNNCLFLPMTGTPIVNKPVDLFTPLRLVDAHTTNSYYMWNKNFCVFGGFGGHEVIGYKNMSKLKKLLDPNMIRRKTEDVLNLPDKIEMIEYVDNTPYQSSLAKKVTSEIISQKDNIVQSLNPLSKMMRLRQVNGAPELVDLNLQVDSRYLSKNAKLKRLLELVKDITESGEKVVIFSNWVEPLRTVYRFLTRDGHKVCCYTGTMTEKDRQAHKETFLHNDNYKVMIGTIGALGTTHTLTVANNVIFYDEPWTAADKHQAEERIHRISATKTCKIYTIITKDTIDERVHNIIYTKGQVSDYIVDRKLDVYQNPELFDYLVSGNDK